MARTPVASTNVVRIEPKHRQHANDLIAVEEPLQIILEHGEGHGRNETPLTITMRTPGHDHDLVTGFLYAEGVITSSSDLIGIRHCFRSSTPRNVVRAILQERAVVPSRLLERNLTVTSACGICGERTLESMSKQGWTPLPSSANTFSPSAVRRALASLEASQAWFRRTGGTHGAALFDSTGDLITHREDVGRHNALDKVVGAWIRKPTHRPESVFVAVSSRASFELVQKTVRARFPMIVAIGAASSLAVEAARRFRLTLVGFARENRFTVYSAGERICKEACAPRLTRVEVNR